MEKLNPCPFCKGKNQQVSQGTLNEETFFVVCTGCLASGPEQLTVYMAVKLWNSLEKKA